MQNQISGVVQGSVFAAAKAVATAEGVREATTGRFLTTLPKVWAVAAEVQGQRKPAASVRLVESTGAGAGLKAKGLVAKGLEATQPGVEVRFYRKYTEGLLRRYLQMTMEAGRVPSLMGREVLGGRASSYRIHGFDDAVNFRLDVEKCLRLLEPAERDVLRRVAMQEYTQAEAAPLLGISLRTCVERYGRSLDKLTGILLKARLLEPFRALSRG